MMAAAGCGDHGPSPPDGGPPLALDVVGVSQRGLIFGETQSLSVRLHSADAGNDPVPNATVRFSIFRDPAGSTLTTDHARTDGNGVASVQLTAGQAVAAFVVSATANNAPEALFDVSVAKSSDDFVDLAVVLSWPGGDPTMTTLRAILFDDRGCADLPPATNQPAPFRALSATGSDATLQLQRLLRRSYAVVGRAEDAAGGRLLGYGCVEVGPGLLPPASSSTLPLPLQAVSATPVGSYTLASQLTPANASAAAVLAPWRTLDCPNGAAQLLLDALGINQGTPDGKGCKSAPVDSQLQAALGVSAGQLAAIYGDLQAILGNGAELTSTLTVSPAGARAYTAEHRLGSVRLRSAAAAQEYDLGALGLPIVRVANIATSHDGKTLTLGSHGFTFGWHTIWKQALLDLSSLPTPSLGSLMSEIVAGARSGSLTGCAAVADVCSACSTAACADAGVAIGASWEAALAPVSAIDLVLAGSATTVDSPADLTVGELTLGLWSSPQLSAGSFSGARK
jgi:hypothetical protein